jgi:superfamily II DNA or RNA helicase
MKPRPYQREAIESVVQAKRDGLRRVMIVLFTGGGKTVVMSTIPQYVLDNPDDATVIIVHRDELVSQTIEKIRRVDPTASIAIEKAGSRAIGTEKYVVASVQTLRGERLEDFFLRFNGRIGLMQIDECHHAVASGYRAIAKKFLDERSDALLLGVTATPNRADGVGLAAVFEKIVYARDFRWAIEQGNLVRPRCYRVDTRTSLDAVPVRMGDFAPDVLAKTIDTPDRNDIIVAAYRKHTPGMRAIVFCATVAHAKHLCAKFKYTGIRADWASGTVDSLTRKQKVDAFRSGELEVLVNCNLYLEGFDVPEARVLINARPTKSRTLLVQILGRVLRPSDSVARALGSCETAEERHALIAASDKPDAIVLDVVDEIQRRGLETIPTLWGLPPRMDLEGEFPDSAVEKVERIRSLRPQDELEIIERAIDCDVILEEISTWQPPKRDENVPAKATFDWRAEDETHWVLQLPIRMEANYPDGTPVENFTHRFRSYTDTAKKMGKATQQIAITAIGYDPSSVRVIHESIVIAYVDETYIVQLYQGRDLKSETPRILGTETQKNEAFFRSERWIEHNRGDILSAISARAEWKNGPPKPVAIRALVELGVPLSLVPPTTGDALALASKIAAERGITLAEEIYLEAAG